jgi:hypothetical protein
MAFQKIGGQLVDAIFGYDFFISYTWADGSKYAHRLHEKLKAQAEATRTRDRLRSSLIVKQVTLNYSSYGLNVGRYRKSLPIR